MKSEWDWNAVPDALIESLESKKQIRTIRLLQEGKTLAAIAKEEGIHVRNVSDRVKRLKLELGRRNYHPIKPTTHLAMPPLTMAGQSVLTKHNADGSTATLLTWDKTKVDDKLRAEAILKGIEEAASSYAAVDPIAAPKTSNKELCTVYTLTDYHLGAYSWADETGADWDIKIAKEVMLQAFADMIAGTPDSEQAVFAQMGDFLHFDGLLALTPTSKNVLDADTRFPLIVQAAIELCVAVTEMLLANHRKVHVLMAEGNHDLASSVWMRAVMAQAFRKNPRVTVEVSPFPFYSFCWGQTFLGWHHGHLQKMDNLPLLFATDPRFRADYGKCLHTYIHTGHKHHQLVIDKGGIVVEQHATLAARDAHGARGFLYANRETKAITYHKVSGEVSRVTVRPAPRAKGAA